MGKRRHRAETARVAHPAAPHPGAALGVPTVDVDAPDNDSGAVGGLKGARDGSSETWVRGRRRWVEDVHPGRLLLVIESVAADTERSRDRGELVGRCRTVRWLASRGARGRDDGYAEHHARRVGGFDR